MLSDIDGDSEVPAIQQHHPPSSQANYVCPCCPPESPYYVATYRPMLKHVNTVHKEVIDVSIFAWEGKAPLLRCPNCSLVVGGKGPLRSHWTKTATCNGSTSVQELRNAWLAAGTTTSGSVMDIGLRLEGQYQQQQQPTTQSSPSFSPSPHTISSSPQQQPAVQFLEDSATVYQDFEVPLAELENLVSIFGTPLYLIHKSWKTMMGAIVSRMCTQITSPNSIQVLYSSSALLCLPGLIRELKVRKTKPVEFLREVLTSECWETFILSKAKGLCQQVLDCRARQAESEPSSTISREELIKKIETTAKEGRLSSATALTSTLSDLVTQGLLVKDKEITLNKQQIVDLVSKLNPAKAGNDKFSQREIDFASRRGSSESDFDCMSLTPEDVAAGIAKLNRGSAAGWTGWTFQAIHAICTDEANQMECLKAISLMFNKMLRNQIPSKLWTSSRSTMIPKTAGGWRPLGIGEAWYRLLSKCIVLKVSTSVGHKLCPLQLGVGISGGCEIAGRAAQLAIDSNPNLVAINLDLTNAFGTMSRKKMFRGMKEFCPALTPWFMWAYGEDGDLRSRDGDIVGINKRGVRQGDPLAPLCFCVGLQASLKEFQRGVVAGLKSHNFDPACLIYGFMDDINIIVDIRMATQVCHDVDTFLQQQDLELNHAKCKILGQRVEELVDPPFPVTVEGTLFMGVPTGTKEFRRDKVKTMLEDMLQPLPALPLLDPAVAVNILTLCINQRPSYLVRVIELSEHMTALNHFDAEINKSIIQIAGHEVLLPGNTKDIAILRAIPRTMGGMGITAHSGITGQQANMSSQRITKQFVRAHCAFLQPAVNAWSKLDLTWEYYLLQDEESMDRRGGVVTARPHISNCFYPGESIDDNTALKPLVKSLHNGALTVLHQQLISDGFHSKAAWLLSSGHQGSGKWLVGRGHGVFYGDFEMKGEIYREALRMRLLLPPVTANQHEHRWTNRKCACGRGLNLGTDPFHLLDCAHGQWYFTRRHDEVKSMLAKAIKKHHPDTTVRVEETFILDSGRSMVADITVRFPNSEGFIVLDVSIVEPAAPTYIKLGSQAHTNTANNEQERKKIEKYETLRRGKPGLATFTFVPFVAEATGRLGSHAESFLQGLLRPEEAHRLKAQMGAMIMKYNASMMRQMFINMEKAENRLAPPELLFTLAEERVAGQQEVSEQQRQAEEDEDDDEFSQQQNNPVVSQE